MSWYYKMGGASQGPVERDALVALFRTGTLTPQVEVSEDQVTWAIGPQVPGLMDEVFGVSEISAAAPTNLAPPSPSSSPSPSPSPSPSLVASAAENPPTASPREASFSAVPAPSTITPPGESESTPARQAVEIQTELPAPIDTCEESSPALEPAKPKGSVGHIVLNPIAHQRANSERQSSGFLKTAACGMIGLAVMLVAGLFAANKVFGLDLRPATVDQTVSRFMIENPEIVAHLDLDTVMKSPAMRRTQLDSNPMLSYLQDAGEVTIVSDSLDPTAPRFLAIIELKRDYRAEFIANLFRNGSTEEIGTFTMHTDPRGMGGIPIAACLPGPRTLLVGSPRVLTTVLERDEYPRLSPRESALITSITGGGKTVSLGLFFDSLESLIGKAKAQIDGQFDDMDKDDQKMLKKQLAGTFDTFDDVNYVVKNIEHMTIEVDIGDKVEAVTRAQCLNSWKAKKVVKALKNLMALAPAGANQLSSLTNAIPVANGSAIEGTTTFDMREFRSAFTSGLAAQGL